MNIFKKCFIKGVWFNGRTKKYNESVSCTRFEDYRLKKYQCQGNKGEIVIRSKLVEYVRRCQNLSTADPLEWMGKSRIIRGMNFFGNIVEIGPETKGNYKIGTELRPNKLYHVGMQKIAWKECIGSVRARYLWL